MKALLSGRCMDGAHNNRHKAEGLVTAYAGRIYAFCCKRTASLQDAEDLAQEICLKLFSALCAKGLPEYPDRFVFTVAHNQLANYYRRRAAVSVAAGR